jgi:hypothetical protein
MKVKLIAIANHNGKSSCLRNSSEHWEKANWQIVKQFAF